MLARIIDGKAIAAGIRRQLAEEVEQLKKDGLTPGLAVVLVGDDPASEVYVRMKHKACVETGIHSVVQNMPMDTSQDELLEVVQELNEDESVHGILVQLPVPKHINGKAVQEAIAPQKDVDGFHPVNVGKLWSGQPSLVPCTPLGIIRLLDEAGVEIEGKKAVVIGRSDIVGKPVAALLLQRNATVTVCHSRTVDLRQECRSADILVVAVGKPSFVPGDWVKPGSVVIDVGVNRVDGKLVGDVNFDEASEVADMITPVPGGVGPMTIAMLLANTVQAAKLSHQRK